MGTPPLPSWKKRERRVWAGSWGARWRLLPHHRLPRGALEGAAPGGAILQRRANDPESFPTTPMAGSLPLLKEEMLSNGRGASANVLPEQPLPTCFGRLPFFRMNNTSYAALLTLIPLQREERVALAGIAKNLHSHPRLTFTDTPTQFSPQRLTWFLPGP